MDQDQVRLQLKEHLTVLSRVKLQIDHYAAKNNACVEKRLPRGPFYNGIYMIYYLYSIDLENFIANEINDKLQIEIFRIYSGRKAFRLLLDMINMFEAQQNAIFSESEECRNEVDKRLAPDIEALDSNWKDPEIRVPKGNKKSDLINAITRKGLESGFRRRSLLKLGWISREDFELLEFAWFVRNCMHNDFNAIANKEFSFRDHDSKENVTMVLEKDRHLYFYTRHVFALTKSVSTILERIVECAIDNLPPRS